MPIPFPNTDIYALTDSRLSLGRSTKAVVESMLLAGIRLIQYREKDKSKGEMLQECRMLREMTRAAGCCFIVNDHVDIAMLCDADGVHVGQDDISPADARRLMGPGRIIGVSTHSWPQAEAAIAGGADYLGVGPVYATDTKKEGVPVGLEYVREVAVKSSIPFTPIGGINRHTLPEVVRAGGRCFAIVSDITLAENIEGRVAELRAVIRAARNT